jgi:drug/metabolite transporter (DMT)-like permease
MVWIIATIGAYLFGAGANILDKFLLGSKRISSAVVYGFYVGLFGLSAFMFAPFGLSFPKFEILLLCFAGGIIFLFGITLLYFAIERAEASRVVPVFGAVLPVATFLISFFFKAEKLTLEQAIGMILLVFGGLLISFDLPLKLGKKKFFSGFFYAVGAGFITAVAYILFKIISNSGETFVTWYVWTRVGSTIGALLLLFVPAWRKVIFASFSAGKKNRKQAYGTGLIFVGNKIMGGISTMLFNYAITLGSVTITNALVSIQYVFVLMFAWILSKRFKQIFDEKLLFWDWIQKIVAIIIIGGGAFLVYLT